MIEKQYKILAREGLHARPAKAFLKLVKGMEDQVTLCKENAEIDAKSMLGILSLEAAYNTVITVKIEGPAEEASAKVIDQFFTEDIVKL